MRPVMPTERRAQTADQRRLLAGGAPGRAFPGGAVTHPASMTSSARRYDVTGSV